MKWSQDDKDTGDYCHGNAIVKIFVGPGSAFMQHVSHPQLLGKSWADAGSSADPRLNACDPKPRQSKRPLRMGNLYDIVCLF